jgi:glucosamine--fructose-6-phosphate aminotransferase (isomerizing)
LNRLETDIINTIEMEMSIQELAKNLLNTNIKSIFLLGKDELYGSALEGALKIKEIAYIHAEGLAAGELKHGSLALIDDDMPLIFLLPFDEVFEKSLLNLHEIQARSGLVYVITDPEGAQHISKGCGVRDVLVLPALPDSRWQTMLQTIALQLLAYHTALCRGCSIDRPRHLAKSVTVE